LAKGESTIVWEIESYEKAIIFIEEQKLSCMALCVCIGIRLEGGKALQIYECATVELGFNVYLSGLQ